MRKGDEALIRCLKETFIPSRVVYISPFLSSHHTTWFVDYNGGCLHTTLSFFHNSSRKTYSRASFIARSRKPFNFSLFSPSVRTHPMARQLSNKCLRPYHVENTGSRPITEVKQRWARLVLGWVTAWEYRVL